MSQTQRGLVLNLRHLWKGLSFLVVGAFSAFRRLERNKETGWKPAVRRRGNARHELLQRTPQREEMGLFGDPTRHHGFVNPVLVKLRLIAMI